MRTELTLVLASVVVLTACSSLRDDGPPSRAGARSAPLPEDPVPRPEAISKYGNGPVYEVFGKRYRVLPNTS